MYTMYICSYVDTCVYMYIRLKCDNMKYEESQLYIDIDLNSMISVILISAYVIM
jgi:hypothetical protein